MVVLRRCLRKREEHRDTNPVEVGALARERLRRDSELPSHFVAVQPAVPLQVGEQARELLLVGGLGEAGGAGATKGSGAGAGTLAAGAEVGAASGPGIAGGTTTSTGSIGGDSIIGTGGGGGGGA